MKKIIFFLLMFISIAGISQIPGYGETRGNIWGSGNWLFSRGIHVPAGATPALGTNQNGRAGALYVDTTGGNKGLFYYIGGQWIRVYDTTNAITVTANQGISISSNVVQLGRTAGSSGIPGLITADREIPFPSLSQGLNFRDTSSPYYSRVSPAVFTTSGPLGGGFISYIQPGAGDALPGLFFYKGAVGSGLPLFAVGVDYRSGSKHAFIHLQNDSVTYLGIENTGGGASLANFLTTSLGGGGVTQLGLQGKVVFGSTLPHTLINGDVDNTGSTWLRDSVTLKYTPLGSGSDSILTKDGDGFIHAISRTSFAPGLDAVFAHDSYVSTITNNAQIAGGGTVNFTLAAMANINMTAATNFVLQGTHFSFVGTDYIFSPLPGSNNAADSMVVWNPSTEKIGKRPIPTGGGSGTVNTGVANTVAYYPSAGTTVDDYAGAYYGLTNSNTRLVSQATTDTMLTIRLKASQTAPALNVQDATGTRLLGITKDGYVTNGIYSTYPVEYSTKVGHVYMRFGGTFAFADAPENTDNGFGVFSRTDNSEAGFYGYNTAMSIGMYVNGVSTPNLYIKATTGNVSIGAGTSPNAAAILDVASTTKGFAPPRMTKTQRDAISSPPAGLMIYQTDNTPGLRVYNGTNWMKYTEATD